jgi:transglutaminase-like putative cysteine protease
MRREGFPIQPRNHDRLTLVASRIQRRKSRLPMQIRYGFDIELELFQPTTIITVMDVHPSRYGDVVEESGLHCNQDPHFEKFTDCFGNVSRRITAEAGPLSLQLQGLVNDTGQREPTNANAVQTTVSMLPADVLPFVAASRYCETDLISNFAWSRFGSIEGGWAKVQAVCDFVHDRLHFSYPNARETRTAAQAMEERSGVCRDFTHLAVTLCRCINIPARFCNGYLGDIGVPPDPSPMDFNAWFEAYLDGQWYTFDARHNEPRIGRVLISRGRDAADVAMITTFGPHRLLKFKVITEEVRSAVSLAA